MDDINGSENSEAKGTLSPHFVVLIAGVCHAANAAYCRSLGDESQTEWDDAPDWQVDSAIAGVEFHLANPDAGDSASHDSWMAQKLAEGWVYGEIKDAEKKTHPCIVSFEALPPQQQFKDTLFRTLVHALAAPLDQVARNFTELDARVRDLRRMFEEGQLTLAAKDSAMSEVINDRDVALAKLAKLDAEPKARSVAAKVRKVGPVKEQPSVQDLAELIGMADTVELVFSDGKKELAIEPRVISGKAWAMTAVGLALRLPEFPVTGPATGPVSLAGYGLFLDGTQVAWAGRGEVLEVPPGRRMDLRNDVVFAA